MTTISRRRFIERAALSASVLGLPSVLSCSALADPMNIEVGLQLYTVGAEMEKDFEGTLKTVAQIGYRQIETPGLSYGARKPKDVLAYAQSLGLKWRSAHTNAVALQSSLDKTVADAKEAGLEYLICASPWAKDPSRFKPPAPDDPRYKVYGKYAPYVAMFDSLTLDDWKWNADLFNKAGEATKKAGIQFGYHNHNFEFKSFDGALAYDELIRLTDPNLVKFELDCGWMVSAGHDPVDYLTKFPNRYRLLHIKDLKAGMPAAMAQTTEVGSGTIDWKRIFTAARHTEVAGYYVEQEPPYIKPPLESAKISFDYLHSLSV